MSAIDKSKITTDEQLLIWLAAQSNPNITQENMAKHHIDRTSLKSVSTVPYILTADLTYDGLPGQKWNLKWRAFQPNELFTEEELNVVVPAVDWVEAKLIALTKSIWDAKIASLKTIPRAMNPNIGLINEDGSMYPDVKTLITLRGQYHTDGNKQSYHINGSFRIRFHKGRLPLNRVVTNTNLGGFTAQQLTQED